MFYYPTIGPCFKKYFRRNSSKQMSGGQINGFSPSISIFLIAQGIQMQLDDMPSSLLYSNCLPQQVHFAFMVMLSFWQRLLPKY